MTDSVWRTGRLRGPVPDQRRPVRMSDGRLADSDYVGPQRYGTRRIGPAPDIARHHDRRMRYGLTAELNDCFFPLRVAVRPVQFHAITAGTMGAQGGADECCYHICDVPGSSLAHLYGFFGMGHGMSAGAPGLCADQLAGAPRPSMKYLYYSQAPIFMDTFCQA
ncbi:unnamed protein product, partial [Sphagnum jensenii]